MKNLLITLYSVLDSGFWNIEQVRTWADKVIVNNDNPECLIVDLCLARTPENALTIIVNAVADSRITFPEKMGELLNRVHYFKA